MTGFDYEVCEDFVEDGDGGCERGLGGGGAAGGAVGVEEVG